MQVRALPGFVPCKTQFLVRHSKSKSSCLYMISSHFQLLFPSLRAVTFYISGTFSIDDLGELQALPTKSSTYTIGPFESTTGEQVKLKMKTRLNLYGIVSVDCRVSNSFTKKFLRLCLNQFMEEWQVYVQMAMEEEFEMALQDRLILETRVSWHL